MAFQGLLDLFAKLHLSTSSTEDGALLTKIRHHKSETGKYINLATGRPILLSSAIKKANIDHAWKICSDNSEQFKRILRKLVETPHEIIITPPPKKKPLLKKKKETPKGPKIAKGEAPKRKALPKTKRHKLWMRDYGNVAEAKCCCCGLNIITETMSEAGHILAFSKGGTDDEVNLRLICRTCNTDMSTQNMDDFMREHSFPLHET